MVVPGLVSLRCSCQARRLNLISGVIFLFCHFVEGMAGSYLLENPGSGNSSPRMPSSNINE